MERRGAMSKLWDESASCQVKCEDKAARRTAFNNVPKIRIKFQATTFYPVFKDYYLRIVNFVLFVMLDKAI
jgi:hypothetical protein